MKRPADLVKVGRKTVPSSVSGIREAAFSEPGPAPWLDACSGVRRSETRSTVGTRDW